MSGGATAVGRDFVSLSRRLLDVVGPDGLGSESDQMDFAVDGIEPAWVLLPGSPAEAEAVLRLCAEHDLAVVPAGSGERLGQGNPPERLDAVLSTSRLDAIVEHAAADMTLTVQAGATLSAVNEALRGSGQWLPFDPAHPARTSIGGLIAANACGASRQAFGTAREWLLGVRAVLADGTAVKSGGRVVKNVAGYDLHKLLVGSFGTLAVVLEVTFKLAPLAEESRVVCFSASETASLLHFARALADSTLGPRFLEIVIGVDHPPLLAVGLAGLREEMGEASARVAGKAKELSVVEAEEPIDEAALASARDQLERGGATDVVIRAGTWRTSLGDWLAGALERLGGCAARLTAVVHAGVGVARLRLGDADQQALAEVLPSLRREAIGRAGYLVIERAPSGWKPELDVWGPPPPTLALMKGIKAAFDPHRLLSPGRFVGGI